MYGREGPDTRNTTSKYILDNGADNATIYVACMRPEPVDGVLFNQSDELLGPITTHTLRIQMVDVDLVKFYWFD